LLGFSKEGRNNQQCLEGAFGWLAFLSSDVSRRQVGAALDGQRADAFQRNNLASLENTILTAIAASVQMRVASLVLPEREYQLIVT
jgi:hypothetical protein